jgi:hypothetical protein
MGSWHDDDATVRYIWLSRVHLYRVSNRSTNRQIAVASLHGYKNRGTCRRVSVSFQHPTRSVSEDRPFDTCHSSELFLVLSCNSSSMRFKHPCNAEFLNCLHTLVFASWC